MRGKPVGVVVTTIASAVLLLGGVIMFVAASATRTASIGWFAYQPLAGAAFFPGSLVVLTPPMATAVAIGVVGLVGLGAVVGYCLGRRRHAAP